MGPTKRVIIIVDAMNPRMSVRYRPSHWREAIGQLAQVTEESIAERTRNQTVVSLENADVLVLNWDVANGDGACEADVTLRFFQTHGRVRLRELMAKGGTLLAECQTVKGVPVQASYDAVFGENELWVFDKLGGGDDLRCGKVARPYQPFARHPLGPGQAVITANPALTTETLFFIDYTGEEQAERRPLYERYQDSLWFGWFSWWGKDWFPVLCAELSEQHPAAYKYLPAPVLLAKCVDRGVMIATTMVIGRARCTALIERVLSVDFKRVKQYHFWRSFHRVAIDIAWLIMTLVTLALLGLLLFDISARPADNTDFSLGLLRSILGVSVIWTATLALRWYKRFVWSRPMGLSVPLAVYASLTRVWRKRP